MFVIVTGATNADSLTNISFGSTSSIVDSGVVVVVDIVGLLTVGEDGVVNDGFCVGRGGLPFVPFEFIDRGRPLTRAVQVLVGTSSHPTRH